MRTMLVMQKLLHIDVVKVMYICVFDKQSLLVFYKMLLWENYGNQKQNGLCKHKYIFWSKQKK